MLIEHQLFVMFNKCEFYKDKIQYLGHLISKEGILVYPDKIKEIADFPVPKYVNECKIINGNYVSLPKIHRRFLEDRESHKILAEKGEKIFLESKV